MLKKETAIQDKMDLDADEYIRHRMDPKKHDELYIHLADLRIALDKVATEKAVNIMDYGCGGSPYRSLFPNAVYHRADYTDMPGLDFKINEDARLDTVPDDFYDIVLSTQVLEHVRRPEDYLAEAKRVLKVGGKLILTTHGVFYDHACPYDFRRWTADGLELILQDAGFSHIELDKISTNTRAVFLLAENGFNYLIDSRRTKFGFALWLFRSWFWSKRAARNAWSDKKFSENRVVDHKVPGHPLYITLMAVATKAS